MQHTSTAQTTVAAALRTAIRSIAHPGRATVHRDGNTGTGVVVYATVAVCKHAIVQALATLGATAVGWGGLHTATGREDSEVTFTYNEQQCYIVTCYSSGV